MKRWIVSKTMNYMTKFLFFEISRGSRDHFCGFKAFTKKTIMHILRYTRVGNNERSMYWDVEMLVYANRLGYKIKVIPVKWKEMRWSTLNVFRESRIFVYMLKLWWKVRWMKKIKNGWMEN